MPSTTPKLVKFRESCDKCLKAKVKCSKDRPLCSRCLTNGGECAYSPSSRAGKKSRSSNVAKGLQQNASTRPETPQIPDPSYPDAIVEAPVQDEDHGMIDAGSDALCERMTKFSQEPPFAEGQTIEQDATMMSGSDDIVTNNYFPPHHLFHQADFTDSFMPVANLNTLESLPVASSPDRFVTNLGLLIPSSANTDKSKPPFSGSQSSQEQSSARSSLSSSSMSRLTTPSAPASFCQSKQQPKRANSEIPLACDCFGACLHAFQSLHHHSWLLSATPQGGPDFDIVLKINQEATLKCAKLIECAKCVTRNGKIVSSMMLATMFGKIMSLYRSACFLRFGSSTGTQGTAQLAFGAYTVTGKHKQLLEIEILLLEVRKVESTLGNYSRRFGNAQVENEEIRVYTALGSYLEKNLQHITEFLQIRKYGK